VHLDGLLVGLPNEAHERRRREGRRGAWSRLGPGLGPGYCSGLRLRLVLVLVLVLVLRLRLRLRLGLG